MPSRGLEPGWTGHKEPNQLSRLLFLGSRFLNRNAVASPSKVSDRLTDGASPGQELIYGLRLVERLPRTCLCKVGWDRFRLYPSRKSGLCVVLS